MRPGTTNGPAIPVEALLAAYADGAFPMADEHGTVRWYTADPRAVFPLATTRPNARFLRFLRGSGFRLSLDKAFPEVIHQCAAVHGSTWISPGLEEAYIALHRAGHAHSVETWQGDKLVGGLYGVHLGKAFFGESMFSIVPNGSKAAFYTLAEHLRQRGFTLFDSQFINDHTARLGAVEISRREYLALLKAAVGKAARF